jgi:hypothetical protein
MTELPPVPPPPPDDDAEDLSIELGPATPSEPESAPVPAQTPSAPPAEGMLVIDSADLDDVD